MNATHLIILNRAAATADGWIHIVPKGELPNREAGIVQVLDDVALDSILAGIAADQQRLGNKWPGVYAGREHFIYNDDQDSAALAWFKNFEKRADGIWAKDDGLTDIGQTEIKNGRYKFTSFVADRKDVQKLAGNKVRILKIDTVGFTNQANGKELLTPITNRRSQTGATDFPGSREPADSKPNQTTGQKMKSVCTLLGLSAEADEQSVHAAVSKIINRGDITPDALTTLRAEHKLFGEQNQTLLGEQCDALMDAHGIKGDDKVRNRLRPTLVALKNREDRIACLTEFGFKPVDPTKPAATRVLNRQDNKGVKQETTATDEQELALKAEGEITTYKITNRCTYAEARNAVRLQKPELFGLGKQS